jgi:uncharacterized protein (TIGR02268 family)
MPLSPSAALLALAFLAAPLVAAAPSSPPSCEPGVRHIELATDSPSQAPEVCIRPGLTTNLLFDSKLARVELEARERFRWVLEGETALALLPSEALADGERFRVAVHFADGAAPASATFALVVHPSQAERQVEVSRRPRPVASYQQEARQARAEARRCEEEKARIQAGCGERVGLRGLIAHGLVDKEGVLSRDLDTEVVPHPGALLTPTRVRGYRSTIRRREGKGNVSRLAVELRLLNRRTEPWKAVGAALVGPKGEALRVLEVWQPEPIPPGEWRTVVVEVEATEREARGPFTLKLWGEEGAVGSFILGGVTFP